VCSTGIIRVHGGSPPLLKERFFERLPTNTFHVGFWFNDPNDANKNGCTFDVTHPTPFNGEHKAGPGAMISVPDAQTNLGPLCTQPNNNGTCNP
jgi:hypothetical protein